MTHMKSVEFVVVTYLDLNFFPQPGEIVQLDDFSPPMGLQLLVIPLSDPALSPTF